MGTVDAAKQAARKAHEKLYYDGTCTVIQLVDVTDEETKITTQEESVTEEGIPCHLSFESLAATDMTETAAAAGQGVKVFVAPEINIPAGSKLVIEQNGEVGEYAQTGVPALYSGHQEIRLELFKGWA